MLWCPAVRGADQDSFIHSFIGWTRGVGSRRPTLSPGRRSFFSSPMLCQGVKENIRSEVW